MAASIYKKANDAEISSLVSDLVTRFIEEQPGTENHTLARDFCLKNITRHFFGDVNPSETVSNFAGVERQLAIASQLSKQAALTSLRERLMAQPLASRHPEPNHRLLSLLFYLQRKPLEAAYEPPEAASLALPQDPDEGDFEKQIAAELMRCSAEDWAAEEGSSGSDLSDWGSDSGDASDPESDEAGDPAALLLLDGAGAAAAPAAAEAEEEGGGHGGVELLLPPQPASRQQEARGSRMSLVRPGGSGASAEVWTLGGGPSRRLVDCVLEARGHGLPLPGAFEGAQSRATEADLMWEAMRALRGIPGKTITRSGEAGELFVDPNAHLDNLCGSSLRALLQDFVDAGNSMLRTRELIAHVNSRSLGISGGSNRAAPKDPFPVTPTVSALCVQIEALLEGCCSAMLPLEMELTAQQSPAAARAGEGGKAPPVRLTLLQVRARIAPVIEELLLLGAVAAAAVPRHPKPAPTPAEVTCQVLSSLYAMLEAAACYDEPRREALLLRLMVAALEPYLRMLQTWLTQGVVHSSWEDFLVVQQSEDISVTSSDFWLEAFRMRQPGPGARSTVPSFLHALAPRILSAGKAVHLMANVDTAIAQESASGEESRRKRVLAASAAAAADRGHTALGLRSTTLASGPGGSFFASFVALLKESLDSFPSPAAQAPLGTKLLPLLRPLSSAPAAPSQPPPPSPPTAASSSSSDPPQSTSGTSQPPPRMKSSASEPGGEEEGASIAPPSLARPHQQPPPLDDDDSSEWAAWVERSKGGGAAGASGRPSRWRDTAAAPRGVAARDGRCSDLVRIAPYEGLAKDLQRLGWRSQHRRGSGTVSGSSPAAAVAAAGDIAWISPSASGLTAGGKEESRGGGTGGGGPRRLPPPPALLEQCLLHPLRQQVEHRGMELLGQLMGPWGLNDELRILRGFFLMGTPALEGFMTELFPRLSAGAPGFLQSIPAFELEALLKGGLPVERFGEPLPDQDRISVEVDKAKPLDQYEKLALERSLPSMHSLGRLKIKYKVTTPLEMVLDHKALDAYSSSLTFLLQVRWAMQSLDSCRMALHRRVRSERQRSGQHVSYKRPRTRAEEAHGRKTPQTVLEFLDRAELFRDMQELMHFASNLHRFVIERNLFSAFAAMEKDLDGASTLDDTIGAHAQFINQLETNCLFLKNGSGATYVRYLKNMVTMALNHTVQWCHILNRMIEDRSSGPGARATVAAASNELSGQKEEYEKSYRLIMRILKNAANAASTVYALEELRDHLEPWSPGSSGAKTSTGSPDIVVVGS